MGVKKENILSVIWKSHLAKRGNSPMSFNDWLPFAQRGKNGRRVCHVIARLLVGGTQKNTLASVARIESDSPWETRTDIGWNLWRCGALEPVELAVSGLVRIEPDLVWPIHPYES
jgi:hypothetical protein